MIKDLPSIYFTQDVDKNFDVKASQALLQECNNRMGLKGEFKRISLYAKHSNKTVAGAIGFVHGQIMWIDSIYVEEAFQNKGLGGQIISELTQIAEKYNLREMQLNTYFPRAFAFFKKYGFEEVAAVPGWKYDITCYLMRKII